MPSSEAPLAEARGVARAFGPARVLKGIDLAVGPGEALAVAGPNGAGKTTLLRLLAGLLRPTAGEVRLLGRPLGRGEIAARGAVGLVSHQSLLYDDLTLLENLTFAGRLQGLARPRAEAAAALEEVGLGDRAGDPPRRLSRGLLQRAALARALLHRPRVLLLDEPFTALDAGAVRRARELLTARLADGCALVVVTHQLAEVWPLATRVAVLARGRFALDEPRPEAPDGLLARYQGVAGA